MKTVFVIDLFPLIFVTDAVSFYCSLFSLTSVKEFKAKTEIIERRTYGTLTGGISFQKRESMYI